MTEAARIGRNFGAIAIAHVAAQVLAFVVSIALTRNLGAEAYGIFVFGFAFPSWFALIISFGFDYVVTIDVAADRGKASTYLTTIAVLRIPLVLIATFLLWVSLQFALSDPFARTVAFVLGVANLLSAYNATFDSIFRGHERFEFSAFVIIVERAIAASGALLLLFLGRGLLEVSFAYLLSIVASMALNLALVRRFARFAAKVDPGLVVRLARRALPFASAILVSSLMYSTAPVLITLLRGSEPTGHFNAAFALMIALMAPLSMYNIVFLPRMARMHRHSPQDLAGLLRRTQRLFFAIGLPAALGGALYSTEILTWLYGAPFREAGPAFAILAFALAVTCTSLGAGTALGATNRQMQDLRFTAVGAATNLALCALLIPSWGIVGAAWAFLIGTSATASLRLGAMHRHIAPVRVVETAARSAAASGVMASALVVVSRPTLWEGIVLGVVVYVGALVALRGITREDVAIVAEIARGALLPRRWLRARQVSASFRAFAERDCAGRSPLYESLALRIADDPELLSLAARAPESQPAPFLMFAAVHHLLLKGTPHPVRDYFPDLANSPKTDDAYPAFRSFCLAHRDELGRLLESRLVQTNDVRRTSCLLPAFEWIRRRGGEKPLALVEVGASAGLNLLWDRYSFDYGDGRRCGDPGSPVKLACELRGDRAPPIPGILPRIAFRAGIDLSPVDPRDPEAVAWLRALFEPEQTTAAKLLGDAVGIARDAPPLVVGGDAAEVLPKVLQMAPADAALCVFHSFVFGQMPTETQERLRSEIVAQAAKREVYLISIEYSSEVDRTQLSITTFREGAEETRVLAHCDNRGGWIEWVDGVDDRGPSTSRV